MKKQTWSFKDDILVLYLFILAQNQFWTQRPQEELDKTINATFSCYKVDNLMLYIKYHQLQHYSVQFLKRQKNACKDQNFFLQQTKKKLLHKVSPYSDRTSSHFPSDWATLWYFTVFCWSCVSLIWSGFTYQTMPRKSQCM